MYNLYKCRLGDGKDSIFILAKKRVRFEGDNKFLEGLCLGYIGRPSSRNPKWTIGYYAKNWGARHFELVKEDHLTIRSENNLFNHNGNLCIKIHGKGKIKRGIWEINKDGRIEFYKYLSDDKLDHNYGVCEKRFSDKWKRIREFKIKNK